MNEMLTTAFRDSAMEEHRISSGTQNIGRFQFEECEHSGHLSTSCMDENNEVLFQRQLVVQPVYGTCQQILTENLNMHQMSVKFMP